MIDLTMIESYSGQYAHRPDNLSEIWRICMGILRGSYLKQNIGDNVDIFLQNKRNLPQLLYFVVLDPLPPSPPPM